MALRKLARSVSSGLMSLTETGPVQRGRVKFGTPPDFDALEENDGNSSRSFGVRRGLSPSNPFRRSLMYVA